MERTAKDNHDNSKVSHSPSSDTFSMEARSDHMSKQAEEDAVKNLSGSDCGINLSEEELSNSTHSTQSK